MFPYPRRNGVRRHPILLAVFLLAVCAAANEAQTPSPQEKKPGPSAEASDSLGYSIELLETRARFEADGSSRREVHARIHIFTELGARPFARLTFEYNRAFEQIEMPLVRVTQPNGGTADILPSAVTDQPNPTVADAPAYQDVRRKSVRVIGLQPGATLEYRVITNVTHAPLAPDFYLSHTFARDGIVAQEVIELDLPASRQVQLRISPATPPASTERSGDGADARILYQWKRSSADVHAIPGKELDAKAPDLVLTTFPSWQVLANRLASFLALSSSLPPEILAKASELIAGATSPDAQRMAIYEFVSQKIRTVDLPLGATGFRTRPPSEILSSSYATPEDKHVLFAALGNNFFGPARAGLVLNTTTTETEGLARPSLFDHILTLSGYPSVNFWMDLSIEVAPCGMIPSQFRGKRALLVGPGIRDQWPQVPPNLPFPATQSVRVDASLSANGDLTADVHYALRGDSELLMRVAFHRAKPDQWKDLAQLLALSDGFRGTVSDVTTSDPASTREPFTIGYEISLPKFVDWTKRPVRIPALLPQIGLPDLPAKAAEPSDSPAPPINLGTPLDVESHVTLRLPPRTTARSPIGTSVERDYAAYSSHYTARGASLRASRHVHFLLREVPAARVADYSAFVRAVQNDEAQEFTLDRATTTATAAPPRQKPAGKPTRP